MKALVTVPNIHGEGGVSGLYLTLREYFSPEVEYFTIGRRTMTEGPVAVVKHTVRDTFVFGKAIEAANCDVVHVNPSLTYGSVVRDAAFVRAAKRARKRVVVFFHGWDYRVARHLRSWALRLFQRAYFRAEAMVVLAEEFKTQLREWGYGGPVYVETTAVNDSLLGGADGGERRGDGVVKLLYMARVTRAKGVYEALAAYSRVRRQHGHVRLTIAGDGDAMADVKCHVEDEAIQDVEFAGFVRGSEKARTLRESDVFVLPTTHGEGMPISVLEAMAGGLPVITRSVGGIKDFFQNERMGFMTESQSPEVFAAHIDRLVGDSHLRRQMGAYNRQYAREHFSASRLAERLEDIYRTVADHGME
jgi:glycosyltransferase involved in cell wall biosynthesis